MIASGQCPWCRLTVKIAAPRVHCPNCGHRADVSRLACDCEKCRLFAAGKGPDPRRGLPPEAKGVKP
jgi:hypothetical protein